VGDVRGCSLVFMAAIVSVVCARRPLSSSSRHPTTIAPLVHPPPPPSLPPPPTPLPENRHPTDPPPPPATVTRHSRRRGKLLENSRPLWDPLSSVATPARARSFFCFVFRGTFGCPSDLCLFCYRSLASLFPVSRRPPKTSPGALPLASPCSAARGGWILSRTLYTLSRKLPIPVPFLLLPTMYRLFRIHAFAI